MAETHIAKRPAFWVQYQRQVLFVAKSTNLGLITVYQFLLIYVLTRAVGPEVYPFVVFLASIGNYILSTDLGFSGFVYSFVRRKFVQGELADTHAFINGAINFYFVVPTIAFLVAIVVIPAALPFPTPLLVGLILYFASIVYPLPWQMVRCVLLAIDGFLLMEALEFCRRLMFLLLALAMLGGLPFTAFAAACVAAWILVFAIALAVIARQGTPLRLLSPRRTLAFAYENRERVARTGAFGGLEFILYNFPYLLIPAMQLGANALVFFDLFSKVSRFSGVSYAVPIDTVLPYQTRAWHEGKLDQVEKWHRQGLLLCLPIFGVACAILLFWGQPFFDLLLHDFPPIDRGLIHAMVVMMLLILFQCTAGRFLVGIGLYAALGRLASVSVALVGAISLIAYLVDADFQTFLWLYVGSYAFYALLYQWTFRRVLKERAKYGALE